MNYYIYKYPKIRHAYAESTLYYQLRYGRQFYFIKKNGIIWYPRCVANKMVSEELRPSALKICLKKKVFIFFREGIENDNDYHTMAAKSSSTVSYDILPETP